MGRPGNFDSLHDTPRYPSRCCSRSSCICSRSCDDSCCCARCCCDGCAARPDHLSKRVALRLSRSLQIVWKRRCSKQPRSNTLVLDGLRSRWDKRRWCGFLLFLVSRRNGDRAPGKLSRGNELLNVFWETSRSPELLHKYILQAAQYFYFSTPHELLQGGRDTWRKFLG